MPSPYNSAAEAALATVARSALAGAAPDPALTGSVRSGAVGPDPVSGWTAGGGAHAPTQLAVQLRVAVAAAREAGDFLRARAGGRSDSRFRPKGESGDVVSDLDTEAERLIVQRLRAAYPQIPILAEESGLAGGGPAGGWSQSPWLWIVDPLDGTNNLAIGLPAYVVGVALCRDGVPVVSVVHEPETDRTWTAVAGGGRSGPGPVSRRTQAQQVVAWTQGYRVQRTDPMLGALHAVLERRTRRTLSLWAPLLGWAMLARGDVDAFIGYRPELIDLPGGLLLAREAGLEVVTLDGRPFAARLDQYCDPDADLSFVCAQREHVTQYLELAARARELAPSLAEVLRD
jgi:myo-inositol-1(or 4)-monophosphatase